MVKPQKKSRAVGGYEIVSNLILFRDTQTKYYLHHNMLLLPG